jgi:beta-alanine degradation protein BauB
VEGGRESTAELAAGVAYFRAAGVEHDVINGGDQDLIFVEIETCVPIAAVTRRDGRLNTPIIVMW